MRIDLITRPGEEPLGTACTPNDTRVYKQVEGQHLKSLSSHRSGKPALHLLALYCLMDFFFNLFTATPAETRTELDSEVVQVPIDFDGSGNSPNCIVA